MSLFNNTQGGGTGGASASILITGLSEADTVTATKDGKTVKGKWVQKPNPAYVGLPSGYTQLEYIEGTGTQYIKTGLATNGSYFRAVGKFMFTKLDSISFGAVIDPRTHSGYLYQATDNRLDLAIGNSSDSFVMVDCPLNTVIEYDFEGNGTVGQATINGADYSGTVTLPLATNELYFFGRNYQNSINMNGGGKAWRTQWYLAKDVLSADFVPCINLSGEVGLYDIVTNTFHGNEGTGEFIAGEEIPSTIVGHNIKVRDYGMWTVKATNGEKTTTQDVLVDVAMDYEIEMAYPLYLYREGDECEDVTGGWNTTSYNRSGWGTATSPTLTKNDDNMQISSVGVAKAGTVFMENSVNVNSCSTVHFEFSLPTNPITSIAFVGASNKVNNYTPTVSAYVPNGSSSATIDVSNVTGNLFFGICMGWSNAYANYPAPTIVVNKIWLE